MKKLFLLAAVISLLFSCSSRNEKDKALLNELIEKNELQIPYASPHFLSLHDKQKWVQQLSPYFTGEELVRLTGKQEKREDIVFRKGDLKFENKLYRKEQDVEFISSGTDSCNKVIYEFSRPLVSEDGNTLLVVISNSFTKCKEHKVEGDFKNADALIFKRKDNQWQLEQQVPLLPMKVSVHSSPLP